MARFGLGLCGLGIAIGCSPEARDSAKRAPAGAPNRPAVAAQGGSVHLPFADRRCTTCHKTKQTKELVPDFMAKCADCHPRHFDKNLVRHVPALDGDCADCHLPHRGPRPHLLAESLPGICYDCHQEPRNLSAPAHKVEGVEDCLACHDAHFGGEHLLRADRVPKAPQTP